MAAIVEDVPEDEVDSDDEVPELTESTEGDAPTEEAAEEKGKQNRSESVFQKRSERFQSAANASRAPPSALPHAAPCLLSDRGPSLQATCAARP